MFNVKFSLIFIIGCSLTSIWTISSYRTILKEIRNTERKIVTEVKTQLEINLEITVGESIMPLIIGSQRGEISTESFHTFTNPILKSSLAVTSVGWIPRIEPWERESFIRNNSEIYDNFTISIIVDGTVLPRHIDNATMWPLLHANPVIQEDFRGVDLYAGLWKNAIDLMVQENKTIISDLTSLTRPLENDEGVFTDQTAVYQLFQPVFDAQSYKVIGIFNRLFFPSRLVVSSLEGTSLKDVDKYQISLTRINENGFIEDIYISTSLGDIVTTGKNVYREEIEINKNIFIIELITETVPKFKTYGTILLVSLFACTILSRMYIVQMNTSKKDKEMAIKYKKATDMKSTFLAEMSHELRTPLNGIIGTIDILTSLDIQPEIEEYINDIKSCGTILITLITGILDFSKIEAGKVDLDITQMDIGGIVHDTIKVMVQSFKSRKNINVILNTNSIPNETFGDQIRIRQVFMNMLSNALKFTDDGSVTVNISSKEVKDVKDFKYLEGKYEKAVRICISVMDTGIGILPDRIKDLFQPFAQIKGKASVGGTGLGLIITKTLCESMDGSVSCSSVYTKGSCFSCEFMLGLSETSSVYSNCHKWDLGEHIGENIPPNDDDDIEQCRNMIENNSQVLVVDDVYINLKVAEKLFSLNGINCDTASDGVHAIKLCGENKYTLIVMDYYMPGMSGVDVALAIRGGSSTLNRDSTIICLTASHTSETIHSIMDSGMNGYELKPISKDMIQKLCKRYINVYEEKDNN